MPEQFTVHANGLDLAVYEWAGEGTPILFVHATGFHARCWDGVINRLPGCHAYAVDLRGHGLSDKPAPPYVWREIGEDVRALGKALSLRGAIAVGHSMGGHVITYAAAHSPELFSRLLLIDPVILPEAFYVGVLEGDHFAAKRRADWASPDEMIERFKDRFPFNRWQPDILRDYCTYGLLLKPDGGYTLACPPEIESSMYMNSSAANIYPEIARIEIPVTIMRAGGALDASISNMSASPTAPDLASRFQHGTAIYLPDLTHFIPMEAPELVADAVRDMLRTAS